MFDKKEFYAIKSYKNKLFDANIELLPSVTELFELELAYLEYNSLNSHNLLDRSAYFQSLNNEFSRHYLMYKTSSEVLSNDRSSLTKNYFNNGKFSTGYATHGLFPYRGKFHPQLIKALINIIGIKENETILDPMCGSGTTNIEASLMGIDSYALDLSPFCQFMTKVKYNSLTIDHKLLEEIADKYEDFFYFFSSNNIKEKLLKIKDPEKSKIYELVLLAFLDALGYSKRVKKSNHFQLFEKVLKRYIETVIDFKLNCSKYIKKFGKVEILTNSTATKIPLENKSVDGVITSPPYSFAIDYVKNDEDQLNYLGYNTNELRKGMIGLFGKNKDERLENYFIDMDKVCSEVARVLQPDKYFVMIIGSNTNQTGGIRLEQKIIDSCKNYNLNHVKSILKPIKGMRNTMKEEYILFFKKERN